MEKKTRILIVDDDVDTRDIYSDVFQIAGFEVLTANDGVEGLDIATKKTPDVIFTGIIMPRMDGFSLLEALRKNVSTAAIPVFISSHMGREDDRQKALALGVKGFIVRGMMPPNQVVERVSSLFKKGEYRLEFSASSLDAPKLGQDLELNDKLGCKECGERLVINLKPKSKEAGRGFFEASLTCAKCGWRLQ